MEKIFTVSELNKTVRLLMEEAFPRIIVRGEISNFKPASSGHWYFSLKDEDSMISCVMFKNRHSSVLASVRDGLAVEIVGQLGVYEKRGTYQINCDSMVLEGSGSILLRLEELKRKLEAEGLFAQENKKALPFFPGRVAIVTSPSGAAIRDILQVLGRRAPWLDICIVPVPVQGDGAAAKIAAGIRLADTFKLGDVIIVGRGGGSLEDLLAFSDEAVVRAVAACTLPIVSAVGHEIDTALCDYAADLRAPTPSAAAELVAANGAELVRRKKQAEHYIVARLVEKLKLTKRLLIQFKGSELERLLRTIIQPRYMALDDAKEDLILHLRSSVDKNFNRLNLAQETLKACSPLDILRRGYALITEPLSGNLLTHATDIKEGDALLVRMQDGDFSAKRI